MDKMKGSGQRMNVTPSRFDVVIRVKKHQEKKAQHELGQIQRKKETEQEALSELRDQRATAIGATGRVARTRATEAQANHAFIQRLSRQIEKQQKTVEKIQQHEDEKREELAERSKSKKIVERLDEKRRLEEQRVRSRKEQAILDVLAQRTKTGEK
jgi:flagellar export protein FliJ